MPEQQIHLCPHCAKPLIVTIEAPDTAAAIPPAPSSLPADGTQSASVVPAPSAASPDDTAPVRWPVKRAMMLGLSDIRTRMAEDVAELLHDKGADAVITTRDLERAGWTRAQVLEHAQAAIRLATEAPAEAADTVAA